MKALIKKLSLVLVVFSHFVLAQTGADYYWVGGQGDWQNLNKWRIGSATGPIAAIIPSRYDNVFFTSDSGFNPNSGLVSLTSSADINVNNFTVDETGYPPEYSRIS